VGVERGGMVKVIIGASTAQLRPTTKLLLHRMICPLSGLSPQLALIMRSVLEPKIAVASGDMTGVHILRGLPSPRPGAYHIAGIGTSYEEAIIGVLAESIERYAQYIWAASKPQKIVSASYQNMKSNSRVLVPESLQYFSESQLTRPGFPFSRLESDMVIGWVPAKSLIHGTVCWLPAQIALVGYVRQHNEPLFMSGVTTGTAAHKTLHQALRNALLELIQIDAAMGNWYGNHSSVLIQHDDRTRAVGEIIGRHLCLYGPALRFYWLPSADLPGLTIACVMESQEVPKFAVGLGCDLRLPRAMYKAFLEAVAVAQLAKMNLLRQAVQDSSSATNPSQIYDLDSNVVYYAMEGRSTFRAKFGTDDPVVVASDLPQDVDLGIRGDVRHLVESFTATGKELVFLDLTTTDIQDLGFCVARVWSPNTISLSLPSAPPVMQTRFQAYGGIINEDPHPYP
jgi:thiazole/oxazole-forming peptide maturase SagD family component